MSDDKDRKLDGNIAGSGKLPGGVYGNVKIAGSGSVDGDLEADEIEVAGSGNLKGRVKAEKLSTAGSCRIRGDVEVGLIESSVLIRIAGHGTSTRASSGWSRLSVPTSGACRACGTAPVSPRCT